MTLFFPFDLAVPLLTPSFPHGRLNVTDQFTKTPDTLKLFVMLPTRCGLAFDIRSVPRIVNVSPPIRTVIAKETPEDVQQRGRLDDEIVDGSLLNLLGLCQFYQQSPSARRLSLLNTCYQKVTGEHTELQANDIAALQGAILQLFSPLLPADGPLYVVIPENVDADEWPELVSTTPADRDVDVLSAEIWFGHTLQVDAGWEPRDVERIGQMQVGDSLLSYSDFYHSLFRVR